MKKLLGLMLLIGFTFSFMACNSDDDDEPKGPQFTIVGTWKVTEKLINNVPQDISNDCALKGNVKFVSGGIFVEDIWDESDGQPCDFVDTIGGNWVQNGNSYKITITTPGASSILPVTFTPVLEPGIITVFSVSATSLGTTTTLVFTKQ